MGQNPIPFNALHGNDWSLFISASVHCQNTAQTEKRCCLKYKSLIALYNRIKWLTAIKIEIGMILYGSYTKPGDSKH